MVPWGGISIQTPDRVGIVIELKYAEDGNLEAACREALEQIEDKKYGEGLKRRSMKKIIRYGIANSHFLRPAEPHFPASQGHIKRSALEIGRARGAPPC